MSASNVCLFDCKIRDFGHVTCGKKSKHRKDNLEKETINRLSCSFFSHQGCFEPQFVHESFVFNS